MHEKVEPSDYLPLYMEAKYEFFKIDRIDLKVASWIQEKHPKALYSFIEYIASLYKDKGVEIDVNKLYKELK